MDPLSITLAVITIATAIKDLVDLAQKVKDSVSQVARNNKEVLNLSEEMVDTIHELKTFCNDYQDILETSTHMKMALVKLIREMQAVYVRISKLLPQATEKTFRQMKVKMQAWIRRNTVQDEIRDLRDRVSQCYLRFTTFTVMRIEGQFKQINHAQVIITRTVSSAMGGKSTIQKSSVHHGDTPEQDALHLQVTNQRLAAFTGSRPMGNLNSSPELTGDLISDLYIRFQLERLDNLLVDLPTIQFAGIERPSERYTRPFIVNGSLGVYKHSAARDSVVVDTHRIQRIIQAGFTTLTVEEAAWEIGELSLNLHDLGMHADAATTGQWTVQLFRILVKANSRVYTPYLAQALWSLSYSYLSARDQHAAQLIISESYSHIQTLLADDPSNQEFMILHCRILAALGRLASDKGDKIGGLQNFEEAVMRFETMLQPCITRDAVVAQPLDGHWDKKTMHLAIRDYSRVLGYHSDCLKALDRFVDAVIAAKKAVAVIRTLMIAYPECYMQEELANMLYHLSNSDFRSIVSLQDAHTYAKDSAILYRKLYDQDPQKQSVHFYNALKRLAYILVQMDHREDAVLVRQEMIDLARRITHAQTFLAEALTALSSDLDVLRRYDEAVALCLESAKAYRSIHKTISIDEAYSHFNISVSLNNAGRPQDALSEAEEAVTQYRALVFKNPEEHLSDLARGLWQLCIVLDNAGNYSRAFSEGHESLKIYESIMSDKLEILNHYSQCLVSNMVIARNLCHSTRSVERGKDVIRQFRQLAWHHATEVGLKFAEAMRIYSLMLFGIDMVPDSIDWCTQSLELYTSHIPKNINSFKGQMKCLIDLSLNLCTQGNITRALEPLDKAIEIGEEQMSKYPSLISILIDIKRCRASRLRDLGRYPDALIDSDAAIILCRETSLSSFEDLILCLIQSSFLHRLNGNLDAAIKAAREAIQLCRTKLMMKLAGPVLQEHVEQLVDIGLEDEAQETMAEIESADPYWKSNKNALWEYSVRLFARGKLEDDADPLRVKVYYEEQMKKGPGYASSLARALWFLGIFYCAQGRHEEGQAQAAELKRLMMKLRAYPEPAGAAERLLE